MSKRIIPYGSIEDSGISAGFTFDMGFALGAAPSAAVTVSRTIGSAKFTTNVAALTFTTSNWMVPQKLTLTAGVTSEGIEWDSLVLTCSGGGYDGISLTLRVPIIKDSVYSSLGANAFVSSGTPYTKDVWFGFLRNGRWARDKITSRLQAKRQRLCDLTFKGHGDTNNFPSTLPTSVQSGFTGSMHTMSSTDISYWSTIEKYNHYRNGFTEATFLIHTSRTPLNKVAIQIPGHGDEDLSNALCVTNLLYLGFDVLLCCMPLVPPCNSVDTALWPTIVDTYVAGHIEIAAVDTDSYCGMGIYFFEKIEALNYIRANYSYSEVSIVMGVSGGGFSAVYLQALCPTGWIKMSCSRGGMVNRSFYPVGTNAHYEAGGDRSTYSPSANITALYAEIDSLVQIIIASKDKCFIISNPWEMLTADYCGLAITAAKTTELAANLGGTYKHTVNNNSGILHDKWYQEAIDLAVVEMGLTPMFTPNSLTNKLLWFDSEITTMAPDGSQWRSRTGNYVLLCGGGTKPTLNTTDQGGRPSWSTGLASSAFFQMSAIAALQGITRFTIWAVGKKFCVGQDNAALTSVTNLLDYDSDNKIYAELYSGGNNAFTQYPNGGQWNYVIMDVDLSLSGASRLKVRINGVPLSSPAISGTIPTVTESGATLFQVGAFGEGTHIINGKISEFGVSLGATSQEITNLESYLSTKYSII